ncbi:formate dehydrogenase accessory protein FdhE [Paracoccus yeei]|uniref:formate dehydrogenase accessory protein FdhE n=1 Tax=Paracoccus yeei TaxID=147645 RepID=UPI003BF7B5AC
MTTVKPDPSMIGGVAKVPLARLPDPPALFRTRSERLAFLAGHNPNLGPYLRFLAAICDAQSQVAAQLPAPDLPSAERLQQARSAAMPPLGPSDLRAGLTRTLDRLLERLGPIDMPQPARLTLDALRDATPSDRDWVLENVLAGTIPADSVAPHLFAAAALQVHAALAASGLQADRLVPVGIGTCPACGGRPVASLVTENIGAEGARYCSCATCQTLWNEVRVKCTCCGSTKGITYRSVEVEDAAVKAEICRECGKWVKILYQNKNPTLEAVADDVASLGLDLMMRDTDWVRGGYNPFLAGY